MTMLSCFRIAGVLGAFFLCSSSRAAEPAAAVPAAAAKNMVGNTADPKTWQFEQHEDATGELKADGEAMTFVITKVDATDWHLQGFVPGLEFKEGKEYVLTFKAKASARRVIQLYAGVNEDDFHSIGLDEIADLTTEWKEYRFTFKAEGVAPKNNRVGFLLGQNVGTVSVKAFVVVPRS